MAKSLNIKLRRVFFEQRWARSCFFGCPDIPRRYMNIIADDELFLCQINLDDLMKVTNSIYLPKSGMLYFFIGLNDYRPIVRYHETSSYDERKNARVDFNQSVTNDKNLYKEYKIIFNDKYDKDGVLLLDESQQSIEMRENDIILLQYNQKFGPKLFKMDTILQFVIDKDDLLNREYDKVRLIFKRK